MKSKIFDTNKKIVFEVCKKALYDFECEIVSSDITSGTIKAKRGGGILSYGHNIIVSITTINNGIINVTVSSNSIGIQILDWGTNSENENELIELISKSFR